MGLFSLDCTRLTVSFTLAVGGGGVSRVNIGRVITASVMSRHTSMIFKMAGKFRVRYSAKDFHFAEI